jgi:hypothetical protein
MAISNRQQIIIDIKTALESITIENGFQTDIKLVQRGWHGLESFKGRMPGLAFVVPQGPSRIFTQGGTNQRTLKFKIFGYTEDNADKGEFTNFDKLISDVEKVLMTEEYNPHLQWTEITNSAYYEGLKDNFSAFIMDADISYQYEWNNP